MLLLVCSPLWIRLRVEMEMERSRANHLRTLHLSMQDGLLMTAMHTSQSKRCFLAVYVLQANHGLWVAFVTIPYLTAGVHLTRACESR